MKTGLSRTWFVSPSGRKDRQVIIMGMFDPKKRKIITAVIVIALVLAMVIPTALAYLL